MASQSTDVVLARNWWDLCALSDDELAGCDIAALNLAAAHGLPGVDAVDIPACLVRLDEWAERVKLETLRHVYRFDPKRLPKNR